MSAVASVVGTIFVFGIVVLVHEFGHFIMARRFGVQVIEFAIGMGPKIWGTTKKETQYSIRAIPFGGYCMLRGEGETDSGEVVLRDDPRSLTSKSIWQRAIIFASGVLLNIVLAFVVFLITTSFGYFSRPIISGVIENSPIEKAGVQAGDRITKVGSHKVFISDDFDLYVFLNKETDVPLEYKRDGKKYETVVHLEPDEEGNYKFGFYRDNVNGIFAKTPKDEDGNIIELERAGVFETIKTAWFTMIYSVRSVFVGLKSLITGQIGMDGLSGPIGIGKQIGDTVVLSLQYSFGAMVLSVLNIVGLLSANLAVMNFIPFPGLDGGHLLFLLIEKIKGEPLAPEKQGIINFIGLILVLALAIFVAFSDIRKLIP